MSIVEIITALDEHGHIDENRSAVSYPTKLNGRQWAHSGPTEKHGSEPCRGRTPNARCVICVVAGPDRALDLTRECGVTT
jgi:hypothetical protein